MSDRDYWVEEQLAKLGLTGGANAPYQLVAPEQVRQALKDAWDEGAEKAANRAFWGPDWD